MSGNVTKKFFHKSTPKTIIFVSIFVLLSCIVIGTYQFINQTQNTKKTSSTTENKPLPRKIIAALGRVEPQGEVIVVGGPIGERIGKMLVREGEQVRENSILFYLESYQERLAQREVAASQVNETHIRLTTETKLGKAQIQEARSRLDQVKKPQFFGIESQQAIVKRLGLELKTAQNTLNRFQQLYNAGAISQQTLDEKLEIFNSKQEELNSAKAILAKLILERQTNILNVQSQIESAQANLQRSQSQVALQSAVKQLNLAQARLERTIIRSPKSARVLQILAREGETIDQEGILQLGNTEQMYVVAEVYETDIAQIRIGKKANITSSLFTKKLQGKVEKIGLQIGKKDVLATDPAAQFDSRVIEVKIRLNPEDSQIVAGLTNLKVDVKIDI